ncbi:MAG TPA: tetratricopeptide repeat protein [Candidatus Polarisedimenticolia bacterium]|nr:tetratricopeptide repeat protein [Candidatus Polarisedimenticolia bacterium]
MLNLSNLDALRPLFLAEGGRLCAEQGDASGALHCFRRALEIDPDCREAWLGLSETYERLRELRRAAECFELARRLPHRDIALRRATA